MKRRILLYVPGTYISLFVVALAAVWTLTLPAERGSSWGRQIREDPSRGIHGWHEACCRTQETRPGAWSSSGQTDALAYLSGGPLTLVVIKRRDKVAGSDSALFLAVQQQSCSSQEIQPSTWLRIASLHLAETLRPTALPHGSALHL